MLNHIIKMIRLISSEQLCPNLNVSCETMWHKPYKKPLFVFFLIRLKYINTIHLSDAANLGWVWNYSNSTMFGWIEKIIHAHP